MNWLEINLIDQSSIKHTEGIKKRVKYARYSKSYQLKLENTFHINLTFT